MSFAGIIFGLLVWFSLPPIYKHTLNRRGYAWLSVGCRLIGICIIVVSVLVEIF